MTKNNAINYQTNLIQSVYATTSNVIALGSIPYDNTKPQQTEGTEILTVTLTPRSASNLLYIRFVTFAGNCTAAIFQDSGADALATIVTAKVYPAQVCLSHVMVAGTTSPTTIKVRCGGSFINGDNAGTRFLGGVANTTLIVQEISN